MAVVDQIAANNRLSAISGVGESFPMHSSVNGKAALALLSNKEIEKLCNKGLNTDTKKTITKKPELIKAIEKIRKTHISLDDEEHTEFHRERIKIMHQEYFGISGPSSHHRSNKHRLCKMKKPEKIEIKQAHQFPLTLPNDPSEYWKQKL